MQLSVVLGILVLGLAACLWLVYVPRFQVRELRKSSDVKDRLELENEFRRTWIQVFGGAAVIATVYAAFENVGIANEALRQATRTYESQRRTEVSDRTFKALELLSKDSNTDAKVAAVYFMERVAEDDPSLYWAFTETFYNYIRVHAKLPVDKEALGTSHTLRADMSAMIDFIRRRPPRAVMSNGNAEYIEYHQNIDYDKGELPDPTNPDYYKMINFPEVDLRNVFLERAMLKKLIIRDSYLDRARFRHAHVEGAFAMNARLVYADMRDSYWGHTNFEGADLSCSRLERADMKNVHLKNAKVYGAVLSDIRNLEQSKLDQTLGDAGTKLPAGYARPSHWDATVKVKCQPLLLQD